jgi:hypothetical protein
MVYRDLMIMANNCKLYNDENSTYYYGCAVSLEKYLKGVLILTLCNKVVIKIVIEKCNGLSL